MAWNLYDGQFIEEEKKNKKFPNEKAKIATERQWAMREKYAIKEFPSFLEYFGYLVRHDVKLPATRI